MLPSPFPMSKAGQLHIGHPRHRQLWLRRYSCQWDCSSSATSEPMQNAGPAKSLMLGSHAVVVLLLPWWSGSHPNSPSQGCKDAFPVDEEILPGSCRQGHSLINLSHPAALCNLTQKDLRKPSCIDWSSPVSIHRFPCSTIISSGKLSPKSVEAKQHQSRSFWSF